MSILNLTINKSSEQILSGIPKYITATTDSLDPIFYTIDGSLPTLDSMIYVDKIYLPTSNPTVIVKFASYDGTDFSNIVEGTFYTTPFNKNARLPHSPTTDASDGFTYRVYPYGTPPDQPSTQFLNNNLAGYNINNPDGYQISNGFDGEGNPIAFTNKPFTLENYPIVYSTRDKNGESRPGVGNLPAKVKEILPAPPPIYTDQFTKLFNPKAYVIYQDFSKENPDDPPTINRQHFSTEVPNARNGSLLNTTSIDIPPLFGSLVRTYHNAREGTITHYYRDSFTNKWIIAKSPYQPTGTYDGNLSAVTIGVKGSRHVLPWRLWARRYLF